MKNILSLTKKELERELLSNNIKTFRASQIWNQIYVRGCKSFLDMTDLSLGDRESLSRIYNIERPKVNSDHTSSDGTRKWLVEFEDKNLVETVFIPEDDRATLCISSQIGCTLSCKFCHTGTQTLVRNLDVEEIIQQIMVAKDLIKDWSKNKENNNRILSNIVFMGMGEPFYNYDNVKKAIEILLNQDGLAFSARRITISTSGLVPEIIKASKDLKTSLAISLHSANDEVRTKIMAINKKYPLKDLMHACKIYNQDNKNIKITFEYIMLKDVNDSNDQAYELINLIKKNNINAKINLIPFNPWMSCGYFRSDDKRIIEFQKLLKKNSLIATIRKTRGDDVMAACGQLKSQSLRKKNTR